MPSRSYLMQQAKTLLRLAKVSSNPLVAGTLAEKALAIKEHIERDTEREPAAETPPKPDRNLS